MSLIIEALKRARDDAVRRHAAARGLPLAPVPRLTGRRPWLVLAIVPLAAALAISLLLLLDQYGRSPDTAETVETAGSLAADRPEPITIIDQPAAVKMPAGSPEATAISAGPSLTTTASVGTSAESGVAEPEQPDTVDEVAAAPAVVTPTSATPPPAGGDGPRIFVGQAQLPNGQLIDLGGIAWSESEPFALLNGQVVGVGELIRTYRVVDITRTEVVLEHDDDRVILRLK